jgi:hypothetical protein
MKLRHRRAHLRIWIALAVLLSVGFGAGIALKQPVPVEPGSLIPRSN